MHVLVSGGAGFIGSHIAKAALKAGYQVTVLDSFVSRVYLAPKDATVLEQDIRNVFRLPSVDAVVHAAARADIRQNWEGRGQRDWLLSVNVAGTVNLLEALHPATTRFVFLSSSGVYDSAAGACESDIEPITSPYSASKLAGEAFVEAYAASKGFSWWSLRLAAAVGFGYHHGHISDFVRMAQRDGKIAAKSDGRAKKSHVHVEDIADATMRLLSMPAVPNGVYNVGSELWGWRDTIRVMNEIAGDVVPFTYPEGKRLGWVGDPHAQLDDSKLREFYEPSRKVELGVREALTSLGWK
jgi:UDP-glucose 4-epimerase